MQTFLKRFEALFLSVFLVISFSLSPAASVRAYASGAQTAVTAWDILQLLLMSAGVTIQTVSGTGEFSDEDSYLAVMSYMRENMEVDYSGVVDNIDSTIRDAVARGSGTAALTVSFADDVWDSLRSWVFDAAQSGQDIVFTEPGGFSGYIYDESGNVVIPGGVMYTTDGCYYVLKESRSCPSGWYPYVLLSESPDGNGYNAYVRISKGSGALSQHISYSIYRTSDDVLLMQSSDWIFKNLESFDWNIPAFALEEDAYAYISGTDRSLILNAAAGAESFGLISDVFYAELKEKVYDVVTPHRVLTDEGAIVGNMTLTIPKSLAVPDAIAAVKEGTLPVTDVLAQVGVVPVDMTKKKAIADDRTIPEVLEAVESTSESCSFTADLTEIFPFCLPFDLIRFLDALDAEPVAPCFEIPFVVDVLDINMSVEFDMSFMDDAVAVFRIGELGCFIIGLILVTQKLIKW